MASHPEEIAETLRELARLDPVELGQQAVLERIVQAAATCCGNTGGVGLLLLNHADPALQPLEGRVVIEITHGTYGLGDEPLEVVTSIRPATDNVIVFETDEGAAGADEDDELARHAGSNPASP